MYTHTRVYTAVSVCPSTEGLIPLELAREVVGAGQTGLQSAGGTFSSGTSLFSS